MNQYFLNKNAQSNGQHEVHTASCTYVPSLENRIDLGYHSNCHSAITKAKSMYPYWNIDGCYFCSLACHHG